MNGCGAHAERTALAWQRTGLTALAVGLLALRVGETAAGAVLTGAGLVAAVALAPLRHRRIRSSADAGHSPLAPAVLLTSAATVLAAVALLGL